LLDLFTCVHVQYFEVLHFLGGLLLVYQDRDRDRQKLLEVSAYPLFSFFAQYMTQHLLLVEYVPRHLILDAILDFVESLLGEQVRDTSVESFKGQKHA
jgi:hypothetical protein